VYHSLYGPQGLVIFDHPYNAEYARSSGRCKPRSDWRISSIRYTLVACFRITYLTNPCDWLGATASTCRHACYRGVGVNCHPRIAVADQVGLWLLNSPSRA
jgi:hypothetical protein